MTATLTPVLTLTPAAAPFWTELTGEQVIAFRIVKLFKRVVWGYEGFPMQEGHQIAKIIQGDALDVPFPLGEGADGFPILPEGDDFVSFSHLIKVGGGYQVIVAYGVGTSALKTKSANWELSRYFIWDRILTEEQVKKLEPYLKPVGGLVTDQNE